MAVITSFERDDRAFRSLHPTQVVSDCLGAEKSGRKVLQLNTYGSAERQIPDMLSQTLQIDADAAQQPKAILEREF